MDIKSNESENSSIRASVLNDESCDDDSDLVFCRICHQTEGISILDNNARAFDDLISPCNCSGSMANVHRQCLQRWASIASSGNCDICGYDYKSRKQVPSILKWFRNLLMDRIYKVECVILLLIALTTPMIIFATLLSSFVVRDYYVLKPLVWVLLSITIISWILYTVILVWSLRFLYQSFIRWRKTNMKVELVWDDISSNDAQHSSLPNFDNYI